MAELPEMQISISDGTDDKTALIKALMDIIKGGYGSKLCSIAEEKLYKILSEL